MKRYYLSEQEVENFNKNNVSDLFKLEDTSPLDNFPIVKGNVGNPSKPLQGIIKTNEILDRVESILGPELVAANKSTLIKHPYNKNIFGWHSDSGVWNNGTMLKQPYEVVSVWIAGCDITVDNGCLYYIPEYETAATANRFVSIEPPDFIPEEYRNKMQKLEMKKGEFVLFNHKLTHYSGLNITDSPRLAFVTRITKPEYLYNEIVKKTALVLRTAKEHE